MEEYRWASPVERSRTEDLVRRATAAGRLAEVPGDTGPTAALCDPGRHRASLGGAQRYLGATTPSLYDLRNLFQVNVEEGRHLWAMVYLLHAYFGRDGREEAEQLLRRHSGDTTARRILGAFNEQTTTGCRFHFTYFTDRDGNTSSARSESGFDRWPDLRVHAARGGAHMFVGTTGVQRTVRARAADAEHGTDDICARRHPARGDPEVPELPVRVSLDLFGSETSSNVAATSPPGSRAGG